MTNKIKITSFVPDDRVHLLSKPVPAKFNMPEWLRKQKGKYDPKEALIDHKDDRARGLTIKRCMPFFDSITNDFVIKTNFDIEFKKTENTLAYRVLPSEEHGDPPPVNDCISFHTVSQLSEAPIPDDLLSTQAPKFNNTYAINTPKGYSTLFQTPHNRFEIPIYTLSGVVDTDTYPLPVNFPFFLKSNFEGVIPAGTPVVQLTIIKRTKWEVEEFPFDLEYVQNQFSGEGNGFYKKLFRTSRQ